MISKKWEDICIAAPSSQNLGDASPVVDTRMVLVQGAWYGDDNNLRLITVKTNRSILRVYDIPHTTVCHTGQQ